VKLTPAQLSLLARQIPEAEAAGRTRAFVIGGENLQDGALRFWQEAAPETALINEYGPTEAVVGCAVYRMPAGLDLAGSVPIGTPIANARLYGVDEQLQPVPVGAAGELLIASVALARGYLGRPDLTAERFVPDPWSGEPGGRLYRTGDLVVRWADGNLVFVGRNDHQIKVRGYRVELGEVEAALVRQAGVREAAVLLRDDGPGEAALVAYVAPAPPPSPDAPPAPGPEELKSRLRLSLPEYMVPATFVFLDALPVTPNGKVDRRALPAPDRRRPGRLELVSPQTDLQKTIADVWRSVLHLEEVGIHDSFFELGGSSLTLFEAYSRLNRILDRKLNLLDLMHRPTIASLAAYLSAPADVDTGDGAAEDRGGTLKAGEDRLRRQLERLRQMPR
jgi:acyl-coenzyme A synthetase/AMP-(fatty) acid ligase/acyl carrier protein